MSSYVWSLSTKYVRITQLKKIFYCFALSHQTRIYLSVLAHTQSLVVFIKAEFQLLSLLSLTPAHTLSWKNLPILFLCVRPPPHPPPTSSSLVLFHTHFPTHFTTTPALLSKTLMSSLPTHNPFLSPLFIHTFHLTSS